MSTAFPLLSLPHLAFEHVHQYFMVTELIHLSQCSERAKNIAKSFETPRKGAVLEVKVFESSAVIYVRRKNGEKFFCQISLKEDPELDKVQELMLQRIAGANRKMTEVNYGWLSIPKQGNFEETILFVVKLIKDLFKCDIANLILCFESKHIFDKLLVASDTLHRAKRIFTTHIPFTHSEMTFMLDNFVTEDLCLGGYAGLDFSYSKLLNFPIIQFSKATWITGDKLLEMSDTCRKIELESAYLISNEDLNQLVKRWLSSTNKTLELVTIVTKPSYSFRNLRNPPAFHHLDLQKVLNGVQTIPGSRKRPEASKHYCEYNEYESGMDVRRADGVMATVMIHRRFMPQIVFIVWNNPNPNLSE